MPNLTMKAVWQDMTYQLIEKTIKKDYSVVSSITT